MKKTDYRYIHRWIESSNERTQEISWMELTSDVIDSEKKPVQQPSLSSSELSNIDNESC